MKRKLCLFILFICLGFFLLPACGKKNPMSPSSPQPTPTMTATAVVTPSPVVTLTPVSTTTFSYDVTVSGNAGTGTITYMDNNGIWQTEAIPAGGIFWVSPTFSVITGSGKQDGIIVTIPGGASSVDLHIYESGLAPLHAHACCGTTGINIPAAPL